MTNTEVNTTPATVAPETTPVASKRATPKKHAARKKSAPKRRAAAKTTKTNTPRRKSKPTDGKTATILRMIARAKGATLGAIMKATDWQAHSVRGFISLAISRRGLKIESTKNDAGERVYHSISD